MDKKIDGIYYDLEFAILMANVTGNLFVALKPETAREIFNILDEMMNKKMEEELNEFRFTKTPPIAKKNIQISDDTYTGEEK